MSKDSPDDDMSLFREAMQDVKRLDIPEPPSAPKPPADAAQRMKDEQYIIDHLLELGPDEKEFDFGDYLIYLKDGYQPSLIKKLRKGQYRVDAELDLHGCTSKTAKPLMDYFIKENLSRDNLCLKIIHGKGWRSKNSGPVLKGKVANWLRRRNDVVAYCSARRNDGGTGAVYVLFSKKKKA